MTASCSGGLTVTGNVTIGSGTTFNGGSGTIDVGGNLTASGTSFTSTSGSLYVAGDFSRDGRVVHHNSGTIILDGANKTITAAGATLNNLQVSGHKYYHPGRLPDRPGNRQRHERLSCEDPSYDLSAGAINISANCGLRNWGTGTLTLGGNLTNNGAC